MLITGTNLSLLLLLKQNTVLNYLPCLRTNSKHHNDIDNFNDKFNLHYVWQYFAVSKNANAKEGWAKNAICIL